MDFYNCLYTRGCWAHEIWIVLNLNCMLLSVTYILDFTDIVWKKESKFSH